MSQFRAVCVHQRHIDDANEVIERSLVKKMVPEDVYRQLRSLLETQICLALARAEADGWDAGAKFVFDGNASAGALADLLARNQNLAENK
jgi:hypothetical protein